MSTRPLRGEFVKCLLCGKERYIRPAQYLQSERHYCGPECAKKDIRRVFKTRPTDRADIQDLQAYADALDQDREKRGMSMARHAIFIGVPYATLRKIEAQEFRPCFTYYLRIGEKTGVWGERGKDARRWPKNTHATCERCGGVFRKPATSRVKYCSDTCRAAARVERTNAPWEDLRRALDETGELWVVKRAAEIAGISEHKAFSLIAKHAPNHPRLRRGMPWSRRPRVGHLYAAR